MEIQQISTDLTDGSQLPLTVNLDCRLYWDSKRSGLYPALMQQIPELISQNSTHPKSLKYLGTSNFLAICLLVAAKDRAMKDRSARKVEKFLKGWQKWADSEWILLELFRAVARLAAHVDIDTPEVLRDEDKAWATAYLRAINVWKTDRSKVSKNKFIDELRAEASSLKRGENPFSEDEPELRALVDFALMLSHPQPDDNKQSNQVRRMKADIRRCYDAWVQSLTKLATHLDREGNSFFTKVGKDSKHYLVGKKNSAIPISLETETSVKRGELLKSA